MPLEDKDIFMAICNRYADQPIEFVMEQYEKAKKINLNIEKRLGTELGNAVSVADAQPDEDVEETVEEAAPRKKYTKRMLKVKPQDSFTDKSIICCICGAERQCLTKRHLEQHGISVEDYKKLCGYAPDQPLMSPKRLEKSREIIVRAQKSRLDKIASMKDE